MQQIQSTEGTKKEKKRVVLLTLISDQAQSKRSGIRARLVIGKK